MAEGEIRFDGRAILVTGAGRGLGRATALLLAERGGRIVVADNGTAMDGQEASKGPAEAVVAEIEEAGGTFTDWRGEPTIYRGEGIATNGRIHAEVVAITRDW